MPSSSKPERLGVPGGGALTVLPEAWATQGKQAWKLEMLRTGWVYCPDGIWRLPHVTYWPRLCA